MVSILSRQNIAGLVIELTILCFGIFKAMVLMDSSLIGG